MKAENAKITVEVGGQQVRLTRKEARLLMGQLASGLRQTFGAGTGRPKRTDVPRCACGEMTLVRAKRRYHVCAAPGGKEEKIAVSGIADAQGEKVIRREKLVPGEKGKS